MGDQDAIRNGIFEANQYKLIRLLGETACLTGDLCFDVILQLTRCRLFGKCPFKLCSRFRGHCFHGDRSEVVVSPVAFIVKGGGCRFGFCLGDGEFNSRIAR